jgi:hypothetical protein
VDNRSSISLWFDI